MTKETGESKPCRVLISVNEKPNPQVAVDWTAQLALTLGCERLTGLLIHVGDDRMLHSLHYPMRKGLVWRTMICQGDAVEVIRGIGKDFDVDLIVITTEEHHSLIDMMRGSTTE